jgi:single-strand DNA-binding protein
MIHNLRNNVRLIGRLGADPTIKQFESGKKMARLALATTESYRDSKGNKVNDVQWHNLVLWGKQADLALKMLKKGFEVAVEGKINHKVYKDSNGENRFSTEIVLHNWLLVSGQNMEAI